MISTSPTTTSITTATTKRRATRTSKTLPPREKGPRLTDPRDVHRVREQAEEDVRVTPGKFMSLVGLLRHATPERDAAGIPIPGTELRAWPEQDTIAGRQGRKRQTVGKELEDLAHDGYLDAEARYNAKGRTSNLYYFHRPTLRDDERRKSVPSRASRPRAGRHRYPQAFLAFWDIYPPGPRKFYRGSKGDALAMWQEVNPDGGNSKAILEAVTTYARGEDWTSDAQKYLRTPANWLRLWAEDEAGRPPDLGRG